MRAQTPTSSELDRIFAALADPTRRAIVRRLTLGDAPVMEIANGFMMSQPAITKHLSVLERAGLISRERDGQRRICRLEADRMRKANEWLGSFREFWEESFDRLDDYLESLQSEEYIRDHKDIPGD